MNAPPPHPPAGKAKQEVKQESRYLESLKTEIAASIRKRNSIPPHANDSRTASKRRKLDKKIATVRVWIHLHMKVCFVFVSRVHLIFMSILCAPEAARELQVDRKSSVSYFPRCANRVLAQ